MTKEFSEGKLANVNWRREIDEADWSGDGQASARGAPWYRCQLFFHAANLFNAFTYYLANYLHELRLMDPMPLKGSTCSVACAAKIGPASGAGTPERELRKRKLMKFVNVLSNKNTDFFHNNK